MSSTATMCHECRRATLDIRQSCFSCGSEFIEHVPSSSIPTEHGFRGGVNRPNAQGNNTASNNNANINIPVFPRNIRHILNNTLRALTDPPQDPSAPVNPTTPGSILGNVLRVLNQGVMRVDVEEAPAAATQAAAAGAGNGAEQQGTNAANPNPNPNPPTEEFAWTNQQNRGPAPPMGIFFNLNSLDSPTIRPVSMEEIFNGQRPNLSFEIQMGPERRRIRLGDDMVFSNMDRIMQDLWNAVEHPQNGLTEQELGNIPMIKVNQGHVEKETQCSTCFDTFKLDETVAELNCKHIFHHQCVEPWLKQQRSCPICRQMVDTSVWTNSNPRHPPSAPSGMIDIEELD